MKRILVRMSAVTAIVVPGVIAAAYAQRSFRNSAPAAEETAASAADSTSAGSTLAPPATAQAAPPSADPFSGSRLASQARTPAARGYDDAATHDDPAAARARADLTDDIPAADDSFREDTEIVQADYEDAAGRYQEVAATSEGAAGRYARRARAAAKSAAEKAPQSLPVDPDARQAIDDLADDAAATIDDAADAIDEATETIDEAASGSRYQRTERGPSPANPLDEPEPLEESFEDEPADPAAEYVEDSDAEPIDDIATATTRTPPAAPTGLEGAGRPGTDEQEGAQAPTITIEKFAPDEIQIGKQATFEISVRNTGQTVAHDVEVIDAVPQGTQLVATDPPAQAGDDGELIWSLGTLKPGDERIMKVDLLPTAEGEVGSVAHVRFSAHATARTLATRPKLEIELQGPHEVLIGELVNWSIRISNPGTGIATGVVLEAALPAGLEHEAGTELEYEVGDLRPNESRTLELQLTAAAAGAMSGEIAARGDGNLRAEKQAELEVLAPGLVLGLKGSKKRYLEREATYTISVSNPGTAAANDIELAAVLPEGLQFVKADNYGDYDAQTRIVHWSLEELPPGETGEVTMTAMPTAAGEQPLVIEGSAARGLSQKQEHAIQVDGVSAIMFTVVDVADPIEVDGEATYEVRVVNQGSKAAAGVRLSVTLPKGMKPLDAEGPSRHVVEGSQVIFDSLEQLAPKADATYLVKAQALAPGDQRIAVQLLTDELSTPVTKEESTRVLDNE